MMELQYNFMKNAMTQQIKTVIDDSFLIYHNEGWVINLDKKCNQIIGDSYVVGTEQCDDNNSVLYDGCYLSQYQCQKSCIQCKFGQCKKCENGYQNLDGKCFEITYDGLTTENEQ
ncbi:unnamed protein product [Paramecium pentaurelia]|uniref:Uncharacterized protein n=1 Tax=Paramecium pentaurelia TaxID=43138 RepID=A0A8S1TWD7_9CILI|nr:unnamed protein product [Paramecium pentaurelia]